MKKDMVVERRPEPSTSVYAEPRDVTALDECYFYHTMDLPGFGRVEGEWDLRGGEARYLGGVELAGKRVLEIGPASGHLTRYMESQGAEVIAYDLSHEQRWDVVPYARYDPEAYLEERQAHLRRLNNGFWLAHRASKLRARVVYGSVYEVPAEIGPIDVCTFGAVLVHLRDPFLALERALRLTRQTVVVTDAVHMNFLPTFLTGRLGRPGMVFLPRHQACEPKEAWWIITPRAVVRFLAVLGFEDAVVRYHLQRYRGRRRLCYTVVARRTAGMVVETER